jgi:hypothetical protein
MVEGAGVGSTGIDKTILRLGGDRAPKWIPDSRENEAVERIERHLQFMNGFDFGGGSKL